MGKSGTLTKDKLGYSLPVDAPLYGRLPILYKSVTLLIYEYVTDTDAAAALLPAQLELTDPAVAMLLFAEYPWSTLGPYNEVAQALVCLYKGELMTYAVRLHVTNDAALAMGRESGGFPKKLGDIPFEKSPTYASWLERPAGLRICSGVMEPVKKAEQPLAPIHFASLRVIPNIQDSANPSLVQLMGTHWRFPAGGDLWDADGSLHFTGASSLDPYHKLPVREYVKKQLYLGDMEVSAPGEILQTL
jgi:acetoacetate decarboxylase